MGLKPRSAGAGADADAVVSVAHNTWYFARHNKRLSAPVIREVIARLAEDARDPRCEHRPLAIISTMLVDAALADAELAASWERALQVMLDLNTTYGWGSKQRKAKLRGLASDPEVLAAVSAVSVGCEDASLDVLAVLCTDGSDASIDALLPHVDRGENDDPRLSRLLRLRTHANPDRPGVAALLDRLEARLEQRSEDSPARALATVIGLGEQKLFWFRAYVWSAEDGPFSVPQYQGYVTVDSRERIWYRVSMVHVYRGDVRNRSSFHSDGFHEDALELGRCEAAEIPAWFARAAARFDTSWTVSLSSNVRGKKRAAISEWLVPTGEGR